MSIRRSYFFAAVFCMATVNVGLHVMHVHTDAEAAQAAQPQAAAPATPFRFHLQEATIADVHRAIRTRQITCRSLIQLYVNRARAYNGASNRLVTRDGAPIPPVPGVVRAGAPVKYPTETVAISTILPDFDQYVGPPIEFGRMEPTASDPEVQQQYGMTIGMPNTGQINALGHAQSSRRALGHL